MAMRNTNGGRSNERENSQGRDYSSCTLCGKVLKKKSLRRHMLVHTGEKKHQCDTCGALMADKSSLTTHKLLHTGQRNFSCKLCGKKFFRNFNLQLHMRYHTGERNYRCNVCGKLLSQKSHLNKHMLVHDPDAQKTFGCDVCGIVLNRKVDLVHHMVKHTQNSKDVTCEACGKLISRNYFSQHLCFHSGGKTYKCNICGKMFRVAITMHRHMVSHSREVRYDCDICLKKFASSFTLQRHKRVHVGCKSDVNVPSGMRDERLSSLDALADHSEKHQRDEGGLDSGNLFLESSVILDSGEVSDSSSCTFSDPLERTTEAGKDEKECTRVDKNVIYLKQEDIHEDLMVKEEQNVNYETVDGNCTLSGGKKEPEYQSFKQEMEDNTNDYGML